MTTSLEIELADDRASTVFGAAIVAALPRECSVFMIGDLGAGKTTVVRAALRALGVSGPIPSPTYTLAEIYTIGELEVQHFDLYRLADPEEFELIGARDFFARQAIRFIEWPDRGRGFLAKPDVVIELSLRGRGRGCRVSADVPLLTQIEHSVSN